jgi:GTP-binding protein HflX
MHRAAHRERRSAAPIPVVALVGYTNAGKSTLLNTLTQAGVLAEDKLFATLDPTTRKVRGAGVVWRGPMGWGPAGVAVQRCCSWW